VSSPLSSNLLQCGFAVSPIRGLQFSELEQNVIREQQEHYEIGHGQKFEGDRA
jgi:hypothetical protein